MEKLKTTLLYIGFQFILFFTLSNQAEAQEAIYKPTLIVSIRDSLTRNLLPSVILILRKHQGATKTFLVNQGELAINGLDTGNYLISFTKVGYRSLDTTLQVDNIRSNKLNVYLGVTSNVLKTVNIVSKKSLITQDLDKIIYNVKDDPLSVNNNLYFLMPKIPLVSLSGSEQVQLKGSQSFIVLVNGKRSSLFNNDPTVGFKTLQASNIDKVEVYTIPPARFDSEGLTGVINVITKKPVAGYTGNINGDFATNNSDAGGQFNYKEGKIGLSFSAYGYDQYPPKTDQFLQRETSGENNSLLSENGSSQNKIKLGYTSFEFTLEPDSLNLISISASGNLRKTNQSKYFMDEISGNLLQRYNYQNDNIKHDKNGDVSVNYQRNFKKNKAKQFNTSYQYNSAKNEFTGNTQYFNQLNYDRPDLFQNNNSSFKEHTIQIDYVQPLKLMTIEVGSKAVFRENKSLYDYKYTGSSQNMQTSENENFSDHQGIFGFYGSLQYKKGKWGIKAGVRGEETTVSNHDYNSIASEFQQDYFNIIPTLNIQRKLSTNENLSLGFTQRIQRPGIWQMNPFTDRSNPNFYLSGNTNLKPVLNNVFEMNYRNTGHVTFIIGGNYSFARNTIQRVVTYSSDSVSRSIYQNIGKNSNLGLNLSVNASMLKRLDLSLNTRIYYTRLQGKLDQQMIKNSGLQGNATLFASYRFNKTMSLNTNLGFTSDAILLQGSTNAYIYNIINFNKQIPKINTTVSAGITNLFNKYRTLTSYLYSEDFNQTSVDRINSQIFRVSINYQFGKLRPTRKAKNIINNDDLDREIPK